MCIHSETIILSFALLILDPDPSLLADIGRYTHETRPLFIVAVLGALSYILSRSYLMYVPAMPLHVFRVCFSVAGAVSSCARHCSQCVSQCANPGLSVLEHSWTLCEDHNNIMLTVTVALLSKNDWLKQPRNLLNLTNLVGKYVSNQTFDFWLK